MRRRNDHAPQRNTARGRVAASHEAPSQPETLQRAAGNRKLTQLLAAQSADTETGTPAAPRVTSDAPQIRFTRAALNIGHSADAVEGEASRVAHQVMLMPTPVSPASALRPVTAAPTPSPLGSGASLDDASLSFFGSRFGHDFKHVRIHAGAGAAESARRQGALAYTVGSNIVFGAGQFAPASSRGQHLLAHELTHVVQQAGGQAMLQRYASGEHAQFGETGKLIKLAVQTGFAYTVKSGETLTVIARRFGVSVDALKEANLALLKKWRLAEAGTAEQSGTHFVEGFEAGAGITVPLQLNDLTKEALSKSELTFVVNGVTLEYGVGIAMPDFYESPAQMASAPASELSALAALILKDKSGGAVTTAEWESATGGRYLKLAEKNDAHFAPVNSKLVPASSVTPHGSEHKSEWEKYHRQALDAAQAGDKDGALRLDSFGDHFLTDAFAAGHIVNKLDVMQLFKGHLTTDAKGEFIGDAKKFFDRVAAKAFVGAVQTEFSKYETVELHYGFHPNIDSVDRFSTLLQEVQKARPDKLANAVAKAVHDSLNKQPGGLPVENARGDKWNLSGDDTLNVRSKELALAAVAQSQMNILDAFKVTGPIDYLVKYKKVWDYVPFPTSASEAVVAALATHGTDPNDASLLAAVVALINQYYLLIISEAIAIGKLKKA